MQWHARYYWKLEYRSGSKVLGELLKSGKVYYAFAHGKKISEKPFESQLEARECVEQAVEKWLRDAGLIELSELEALWKQIEYLEHTDRDTIKLIGKLFDKTLTTEVKA
jgi:hypothetical protein